MIKKEVQWSGCFPVDGFSSSASSLVSRESRSHAGSVLLLST